MTGLAYDRLRQFAERIDDRRRPPRVVAWGGRPGIDIQVGSRRDLRRRARIDQWAALLSAGKMMEDAMRQLGESAVRALRPAAGLAGTLEGVDEDTILARWERTGDGRLLARWERGSR